MLPTVFALAATGAYTVGANLATGERLSGRRAAVCGALAVVLVLFFANLVTVVEVLNALGLLSDQARAYLTIKDLPAGYAGVSFFPPDGGWWTRSSRVVWTPPLSPSARPRDYTINEFPYFSFLIGDLHPHVLALPFTLLLIGLILSTIRAPLTGPGRPWLRLSRLLLTGVLFGAMGPLNTWDLPTTLFLLVLALALHAVLTVRIGNVAAVRWAAISAVATIALSLLVYAPFYHSFDAGAQVQGLRPVPVPTQPQHFLLFWG